jgi:hypothetical protein
VISTETYEYDTYGNVLKHTVTYGDVSKTTSALYTGSGNQLDSTTDELGKITRYGYDLNTGVLDWVQYPNDTATTRTNYVYDSMYRLVSTNMTNSDGKQLSATYTYDKDNITQISTKSTVYNFVYGDFSLRSQVSIGSNLLTRYEYTDDENKNLSLLEYGNGHVVKYSYDDLGRLSQEQYLGENGTVVRTITYAYNNSGVLATMTDSKTGVTTKYHYDHAGRALGQQKLLTGKPMVYGIHIMNLGNSSKCVKCTEIHPYIRIIHMTLLAELLKSKAAIRIANIVMIRLTALHSSGHSMAPQRC